MKKYIPVIVVLGVALLAYPKFPKVVTYGLLYMLMLLIFNKWDTLATYFK